MSIPDLGCSRAIELEHPAPGARAERRQTLTKGALERTFARVDWFEFVVLLLALALRLFRLGYQSFWADESDAPDLARMPYSALLSAPASVEPHPPLYYGFLHLWRSIAGQSDFALRLPAVDAAGKAMGDRAILGVVTVP